MPISWDAVLNQQAQDPRISLGAPNAEDEAELMKAMQVGYGTDAAAFTGIRAIVPESLESTLKLLTYGSKQFEATLFRRLYDRAKQARSTVEEYSTIDSWGESGTFMAEMTDPDETDFTMTRHTANVAYQRTKVKISHVSTFTEKLTDLEAKAALAGTRRLMIATERTLYDGDATILSTEFTGIGKTVAASGDAVQTIDLAGATLDEDYIVDGTHVISDRFGTASDLFCGTAVLKSLNKTLESGSNRIIYEASRGAPQAGRDFWFGRRVKGLVTEFGDVQFNGHLFLGHSKTPPTAQQNTNCPTQPTLATAVNADATSLMVAGTHYYKVVAENVYGLSEPSTAVSAVVATTNTHHVTLTITKGSGTAPSAYRVYRGTTGAGVQLFKRVAYTASPQTLNDLNADRPDCYDAYLVDLASEADLESMAWKQFAPMSKLPLATIGSYIHWLQYLYGMLVVYAPKRIVRFKNVGV